MRSDIERMLDKPVTWIGLFLFILAMEVVIVIVWIAAKVFG